LANLIMILRAITCLTVLFCSHAALCAELRLSPLFTDGAVLQRDKPVPVWGWAAPGQAVHVTFHGQTVDGNADAAGHWQVALPAMSATAENSQMTVEADGQKLVVRDVVVGEVWLCSGQSNMQWAVSQTDNAKQEIAAADFSLIRHFRVPITAAEQPQESFKASRWVKASPQTVAQFSAVPYFFARDLYQKLNVPIGLVNAAWGGKMIEVFMSPELIASRPEFSKIDDRWKFEQSLLPARLAAYERKAATTKPATGEVDENTGGSHQANMGMDPRAEVAQHRPGCVFNGMINPVIRYGIRGVIWYQGEHNISRPEEYQLQFTSMIADWRKRTEQGDVPFYFCQLSTFDAPMDKTRDGYARLREAQRESTSVANTAMAVTFDKGLGYTVHPTDKQDVGARLARIAEAKTYGMKIEWSGPMLASAEQQGHDVRLTFDHATGMTLRPGPENAFEIAGPDGKFRGAAAKIDGDCVVLDAGDMDVREVRYAWANSPVATLFNSDDLPASPFHATVKKQ